MRRSAAHKWLGAVRFTIETTYGEVNKIGETFLQEFPTGLLIPRRYYRGAAYWDDKTNAGEPVIFADSVVAAGAVDNAAECYFRVPWPEDVASGNPKRMLGVECISSALDDPADMRRLGRYLNFGWFSVDSGTTKLDLKKSQHKVSRDCTIHLVGRDLTVTTLYDKEDLGMLQFVRQVEEVLSRVTTCDFASYDPCTGYIINAHRRDASRRRTEGVVRYASLHDQTYFGFCNKRGADWEVMGPRPEVRAAFRREAGLER